MALKPEQLAFLDGLRNGNYDIVTSAGNINILPIQTTLTSKSQADFARFKAFLADHGRPNPQPGDLYMTVMRQDFLNLLLYADDRQCLILQNCFGLSDLLSPGFNGQVQLINKGNFHQIFNRTNDDFFDPKKDTVYRNGSGALEFFKNMSFSQAIFSGEGETWISNFRALYPPHHRGFIFGYLLPVKALVKLLSDVKYSFCYADVITLRWGLTAYDSNDAGKLGNFTLVIGTPDLLNSTTIEFRFDKPPIIKQGGDDSPVLCPPNSGC